MDLFDLMESLFNVTKDDSTYFHQNKFMPLLRKVLELNSVLNASREKALGLSKDLSAKYERLIKNKSGEIDSRDLLRLEDRCYPGSTVIEAPKPPSPKKMTWKLEKPKAPKSPKAKKKKSSVSPSPIQNVLQSKR